MTHPKFIILFLLLCVGYNASAQQVVFADKVTKSAIRGVEVESEGFGQMTNKFGMIDISKIRSNQKLFITHLSYEPKIVLKSVLSNLTQDSQLIFYSFTV